MEQEKEIVVINLSSKVISPRPGGKTFQPFTVYEIYGNDGIKYETTGKDIYNSAQIGQPLKIKFKVETKSSNGRIYTSYKIDSPKKSYPQMGEIKQEILNRIDLMEKNILARLNAPANYSVDPDPNQLSLFDDPERAEDLYEGEDHPY